MEKLGNNPQITSLNQETLPELDERLENELLDQHENINELEENRQQVAILNSEDIDKQLEELEKIEQEKRPDSKNFFVNKLKNLSKIVFSRESTYRGLLDVFAIDLPSLIAASSRGWKYLTEDVFKLSSITGMIFAAPLIAKTITKKLANKVFSPELAKEYKNLMLFNREELEDDEKFDNARKRIVQEEVQDQLNLIKIFGTKSKQAEACRKNAKGIVEFMNNYEASPELREKVKELKEKMMKTQSIIEGCFYGGFPFVQRLFRRYVLGEKRFTGTLKYLTDEQSKKVGFQKFFKVLQVVGTPLSMLSGPTFVRWLLKKINDKKAVEKNSFVRAMKGQMDTKHSFYPKLGLFASYGQIPSLTSRIFNAQDIFEMTESVIKFLVSGASLLFGDRLTTGNFARAVDKKLVKKFGIEPGLMVHKTKHWLGKIFPEATKFNDILNRTKDNPELEKAATHKYQSIFYKGFTLHSLATYLIKMSAYKMTEKLVKKAVSNIK